MFQACSNTQNFLSQNLDDAMSHFVAPEADALEDGFNEALQSDCDCRQWAFQFLQPKAPTPIPTLPVEQEFEEHFAHEGQTEMETETEAETEIEAETETKTEPEPETESDYQASSEESELQYPDEENDSTDMTFTTTTEAMTTTATTTTSINNRRAHKSLLPAYKSLI